MVSFHPVRNVLTLLAKVCGLTGGTHSSLELPDNVCICYCCVLCSLIPALLKGMVYEDKTVALLGGDREYENTVDKMDQMVRTFVTASGKQLCVCLSVRACVRAGTCTCVCVCVHVSLSFFFQHVIIIKFKQEQTSHAHACTKIQFKSNNDNMGSEHHPLSKY